MNSTIKPMIRHDSSTHKLEAEDDNGKI